MRTTKMIAKLTFHISVIRARFFVMFPMSTAPHEPIFGTTTIEFPKVVPVERLSLRRIIFV